MLLVNRDDRQGALERPVSGEIESSPVVAGGVDYLGDWAGNVYALDLASRKPRWVYHDGCKITASVALAGGSSVSRRLLRARHRALALDGPVALERVSGRPGLRHCRGLERPRVRPFARHGRALRLHDAGRYLWHVSTGGLVYSAPAVWRGRVYFGSYTGTLYCVSASTAACSGR